MPGSIPKHEAMPTASDWGALFDLQREHAAEIRVIKTGYTHIVQQMAEITVTLHAQDRRIADNANQLSSIESKMDRNNSMTEAGNAMLSDVKDAVTTAAVLTKVAKFAAAAILTGSALWLALKDVFHWGKP